MGLPKYLIDTCSLTKMRHTYPEDVFPDPWLKLTELADSGILISAEDVWEELNVFEDEISSWAQSRHNFFQPLTPDIQLRATEILSSHPGLLDLRKNKSSADPFVIATAVEFDCSVVTEEKASNSYIRPKIPNVCSDLSVECIDIVEMFRREGLGA
ncbi:DUF4411 family protein [Thiohalophilus thiocyanatoxydans]|uniref:Uncharacterized protein DUF4411 n=1 Tax=Thiohalophilus thiocyanatoxydans TaxID=381308 RepID=A0A4R8IPX2_9GAMM|nr:DUF4411 family protein [Thiohalophilus thiocyanatoxydans]TDY03001.1 uncharacterized protein DUF4411 [Thiohalophilus thiocyanatoxydans]